MEDRTITIKLSTGVLVVGLAAAGVAAYYYYGQQPTVKKGKKSKLYKLLEDFQAACKTPAEVLQNVAKAMTVEMNAGLRTQGGSRLKMLPSFVDNLPAGHEKGLFYALDLGGTNFRVLRTMLGGREGRILRQEYAEVSIPQELMVGTSEALFDFIATKLAEFVAKESSEYKPLNGQRRELGFTFSFPCNQTAINGGTLLKWTKGFNISGTVGKDVVKILEAAMQRKNVDMNVTALVNDTVGTLAGARYWNGDAMVALILGTGSNACYVEKVSAITKWEGPKPDAEEMVVNIEWGNFWSSHLPITDCDRELDDESLNPKEQGFEKLIGGMYLGDIVRRELLKLSQEAQLFGPTVPAKLTQPASLQTPKMSKMDEDDTAELTVVEEVLRSHLQILDTTVAQRKIVQCVCRTVAERAARLAAAGVVGVLAKIGRDGEAIGKTREMAFEKMQGLKTMVAVDGGLYEHYPKFRNDMHRAVSQLLGDEAVGLVSVELSKDGSGIGAALLAASQSGKPE
eukprot:jgi/Mesen1/8881/ME000532S08274